MSHPDDENDEFVELSDEAETSQLGPDHDPPTDALPADPEPETANIDSPATDETAAQPSLEPPPPPGPPSGPSAAADAADRNRNRGLITLAVSILASLLLVGTYLATGGLDYKPAKAADACDYRPWTDPQGAEEIAQQFAFSAIDGAACELGVSREELVRALADDQTRAQFAEDNDLSDSEIEDAFRSGLKRAVQDAQDAGALSPLAATAANAAIAVAPMSALIELIGNSEQLFTDGVGGIGDIGSVDDALNAIGDALGAGGTDSGSDSGSGTTGDSGTLDALIPDDLKQKLDEQLPKGAREDLQNRAEDEIRKGLDNLLNP